MKKLFALLVIASMLISMAVIVPQAADIEGDWMTYRNSAEYFEPDPDTGEVTEAYRAAAGYEYTSEGFTIKPADYTGTNPFMKVETKDKHNLKDGLYLKFRIDEFSYKGEEGGADEWICLTFGNEVNFCPGTGDSHGGGFLIRGAGNGEATSSMGNPTVSITPEVVDGHEVYTYEITWNGTGYEVIACGVPYTPDMNKAFTDRFESINEDGEFYIGLALHSNVANGKAALTILEYGHTESDAEPPQGSDSKDPEENNNVTAPIADPSTVEANQPCILWDASSFKAPVGGGFTATAMGNNAFHFTVSSSPFFFAWSTPKSVSYNVEDFPVLVMMVKDFWNSGLIWYNCGDIMGPTSGYSKGFSLSDSIYYETENDEFEDYSLIYLDLTGLCSGRINNFRIDIHGVDLNNPEFDICYMGCFRSIDEAEAYGATYLGVDAVTQDTGASGGDDTQAEAGTNAEADTTVEAGTGAEAGTTAEAGTNAEAGTSAEAGTTATTTEEGGCASVVGFGLTGLFALAALVVLKKKD